MTRLDHVGLNVADLAGMTDFYVRGLGYRVQLRFALTELDLTIAMLVDADDRRFELLARSAGTPGLRAATPVEAAATWGYGHVAFTVVDLRATVDQLLALGAAPVLDPRPSPEEGFWFAWVHDPEGNLVELIGPAPA